MKDRELKQILQEIKDDCRKREDCEGCKFDTDSGCRLKDVPNEWDLIGMHTDKWHKLYDWLNDTRLTSAPEPVLGPSDYTVRKVRHDLIDEIMEYMEELEEEEDDET